MVQERATANGPRRAHSGPNRPNGQKMVKMVKQTGQTKWSNKMVRQTGQTKWSRRGSLDEEGPRHGVARHQRGPHPGRRWLELARAGPGDVLEQVPHLQHGLPAAAALRVVTNAGGASPGGEPSPIGAPSRRQSASHH